MEIDEAGFERADGPGDLSVSDGTAMLVLSGEFDLSNAGQLRERLARDDVLQAGAVRVDLTGVTFLDSVIVGVIVAACKRVRAAGNSFSVICDIRSTARSVFAIDGLLEYLQVEEPPVDPS
jgi:anti-anti-sigma factor